MANKHHILFLTVGNRVRASARYRAMQYIPFLEENGFIISILEPMKKPKPGIKRMFARYKEEQSILKSSKTADIVVIQKRLFRPKFLLKIKRKVKVLVFDFDDIVHTTHDQHWSYRTERRTIKRFNSICRLADLVISGNSHLAELANRENGNVKILPTVVDLLRYKRKIHSVKNDIVLGWIGQPNNYPFLEEINPVLASISADHPNIKILIISKGMPQLDSIKMEVIGWSEETETDNLLNVDIGLMPMPDDEWSKGKCALKAIQYMAAGIPVVCANVGVNPEVVRHGIDGFCPTTHREWKVYLECLIKDSELRTAMGESGIRRVKRFYNLKNESNKLASWLKEELYKKLDNRLA